jgi:hypothetical protein
LGTFGSPFHEPLQRNLQEVFGEGDAARRRAAIDEDRGALCDPRFHALIA